MNGVLDIDTKEEWSTVRIVNAKFTIAPWFVSKG